MKKPNIDQFGFIARRMVLLTGLVISFTSWSQNYIREGFIVTNSGDTINGFLHDEEWNVSPTMVKFQKEKNGPIESYSTADIVAFYTSRQVYYERHRVKYDGDVWQVNKTYPQSREPLIWVVGDYFLETLVKSKGLSLYDLLDPNGRRHFIIRYDTIASEELMYRQYTSYVQGLTKFVTSNQWKQQLLNITADCPDMKQRVLQARYTPSVIIKLVETYNKCKGESIVRLMSSEFKAEKKKPYTGLLVQPFLTDTEVIGAYTKFNAVNFAAGLSFEFFSKKKPNRISSYNELKFINVKQVGRNSISGTNVDFSVQAIMMSNMIRFSYPTMSKSLFWNLGLINGYRINTEAVNQINGYDLARTHKTGFVSGLALGMGTTLAIKERMRGSIELRYEVDQEPFTSSTYVGAHRVGIVIGIQK